MTSLALLPPPMSETDNTIVPVRARRGYIETKRYRKDGAVVKAKQHVVGGMGGVYSAKEMEKEMQRVAAEVGASEDDIRIETYARGEAPVEVNPVHRGLAKRWDRPSRPTEVAPSKPFQRVRTQFTGWSPPTPEELEERGWPEEAAKLRAKLAAESKE